MSAVMVNLDLRNFTFLREIKSFSRFREIDQFLKSNIHLTFAELADVNLKEGKQIREAFSSLELQNLKCIAFFFFLNVMFFHRVGDYGSPHLPFLIPKLL